MGKGGGTPSAPDMSQQIGHANQTFDTATSNAAQTMNTAKGYNDNAQKTLSNITGSQTPVMNSVNDTAQQNLQSYGKTFVPLQQQQAQQAQDYGSEANTNLRKGMATADVNANFNAQRANSQAALASEGVDPASIHGGALDAQSRVQQAAASAQAGTQSVLQTQDTARQLTSQANQLGLQVGQAGTGAAATGAGIGSGIVNNTNATNSAGVNNLTAANTYLNTATGANSSAANIQHTQFQDQLAAQQAAAANGPMSQIGALAGSAMKAYTGGLERGGPVPHGYMAGGAIPAPSYAHGGPVTARGALPVSPIPGSTDTKPALLTPDEFVIPRDVATWRGHQHWYKQMDKAREEMAAAHGIPPQMSSVHTAKGH